MQDFLKCGVLLTCGSQERFRRPLPGFVWQLHPGGPQVKPVSSIPFWCSQHWREARARPRFPEEEPPARTLLRAAYFPCARGCFLWVVVTEQPTWGKNPQGEFLISLRRLSSTQWCNAALFSRTNNNRSYSWGCFFAYQRKRVPTEQNKIQSFRNPWRRMQAEHIDENNLVQDRKALSDESLISIIQYF